MTQVKPEPQLNLKTAFPRYEIPMLKIKWSETILPWPGDLYTGKTTSLYWEAPLVAELDLT